MASTPVTTAAASETPRVTLPRPEPPRLHSGKTFFWGIVLILAVGFLAWLLIGYFGTGSFEDLDQKRVKERQVILQKRNDEDAKLLNDPPSYFDKDKGKIRVPITEAMKLALHRAPGQQAARDVSAHRFPAAARRCADLAGQGRGFAQGRQHQPVGVQPDLAPSLARSFSRRRVVASADARAAEHDVHASARRCADPGRDAAGRHRRDQYPDAAPGYDQQRAQPRQSASQRCAAAALASRSRQHRDERRQPDAFRRAGAALDQPDPARRAVGKHAFAQPAGTRRDARRHALICTNLPTP